MNFLPSFTRTCARQTIALRPSPSTSTSPKSSRLLQRHLQPRPYFQSRTQSRTLSSASSSTAQPTDPTPDTAAASTSTSTSTPTSASTSTSTSTSIDSSPSTSPSGIQPSFRPLHHGTVSRAGTMAHTVQISVPQQHFDKFLQKHYQRPRRLLAHDPHPAGFLREGDLVEYGGWTAPEKARIEAARKAVEDKLVEVGKIRLRTRSGRERKLSEVGVKGRQVKYVVRRVLTPFGERLEDR